MVIDDVVVIVQCKVYYWVDFYFFVDGYWMIYDVVYFENS